MPDVLLNAPSKNAIQKTLAAQLLNSSGVGDPITFADVDGIPNLPGVLVINRIDANGVATASKREYIEYSGTSGVTVLITTRNVDSSNAALTHAVGSIVEFIPDVTWADRIYDALSTVVDTSDVTKTKTGMVLTSPKIGGALISNATLSGTIAGNATLPGAITLSDLNVGSRKTKIYDNGNAGASLAINLNNGETQKLTLTISMATISLVNMEEGDYLTLYAIQDGTGSRKLTFAQSGGSIKYAGGASLPLLSSGANDRDILGIRAFNASISDVVASSLDLS